ncbi:MAG: CT583 family protein, partial [Verrucomicrobia bacterium]|nr:CT583 family protein [Verrucomicrobiota bacterium]
VSALNEKELESLKILLQEYKEEDQDIHQDLLLLSSLTSEVKAINNQAAILHGERIKKAQEILKKYKEGAFTFWLIQTYGNRQTPYNFLQYFELYQQLPQTLLPKLDEMPRQAAYTLASRLGPFPLKEEIIKNYNGETKQVLLEYIRKSFPLSSQDKRAQDLGSNLIKGLQKISIFLSQNQLQLSNTQRKKAEDLLNTLQQQIRG